jgi:hypothetical protein
MLITEYSPTALPQAQHIAGGNFDLVLIDGDHTRTGVLRDANGVLPFLDDGAHVLFHDCHNADVKAGIDEFARRHANRIVDAGPMTREITLHDQGGIKVAWGGLRVIQVR